MPSLLRKAATSPHPKRVYKHQSKYWSLFVCKKATVLKYFKTAARVIETVLGDCIFLILGQHGANGEFVWYRLISFQAVEAAWRGRGRGIIDDDIGRRGKHEHDQDEYDIGGMESERERRRPESSAHDRCLDRRSIVVAISSATTTARQHCRRRANDDSMSVVVRFVVYGCLSSSHPSVYLSQGPFSDEQRKKLFDGTKRNHNGKKNCKQQPRRPMILT